MATKVRIRRKPEQEAKTQIKRMLDELGICYVNVAGGPGGTNGASDMIVCYKGLAVAVEGKTPHGRQADAQKEFQAMWEASGGIYTIAKTWEELELFLDRLDMEIDAAACYDE